jgi:hypothetical protein
MSKASKQHRSSQSGGGNVVGKAPGSRLHQPPSSLLGTDRKSGQTQPTGQRKSTRSN